VGHEFALLNRLVPLKVLAPTRVHIRNSRNGAIQPVRQAGWGAGDRKVQPRGTYSTHTATYVAARLLRCVAWAGRRPPLEARHRRPSANDALRCVRATLRRLPATSTQMLWPVECLVQQLLEFTLAISPGRYSGRTSKTTCAGPTRIST